MKLDVCAIDDKADIVAEIPQLQRIPEIVTSTIQNKTKFVRWIVIMFAEDSYIHKYTNLTFPEKKERAALDAGWNKNKKGEFQPSVKKMISMQDEKYASMVFGFLKWQKNLLLVQIITAEARFWDNTRILLRQITGEKDTDLVRAADTTGKLRAENKQIAKDLKEMYSDFYGKDMEVKGIVEEFVNLEYIAKGFANLADV